MTKKFQPGLYRDYEGKLFVYLGEEPQQKDQSYFNMLIHFPEGTHTQTFEDSGYMTTATLIDPEAAIKELHRQASKCNKLVEWINSQLEKVELLEAARNRE